MKNFGNFGLALLVGLIMGVGMMTSCSKCYTCQHPVEVKTADTSYTSYQEDELCTASDKEIKEKEDNGFTCSKG